MKILTKDAAEKTLATDALILPLAGSQRPPKEYDPALRNLITKALRSGEFTAKAGSVLVLHTGGLIRAERMALVGLGDRPDPEALRKAGGATAKALRGFTRDAALSTATIDAHGLSAADFVEGAILGAYEFTAYKKAEKSPLASLTVLARKGKALSSALDYARSVAEATNFSRDLINTPAREMTPGVLARTAKGIKGITVKILGGAEAKKLGMGAYLSVAGGSKEPPCFIIARYNGGGKKLPTVLVGKSITFDSGGLSLKPSESMETMKYDMSGGAAVLGAMKAASELRLGVNIIGLLPATENLPGGPSPSKPGDVVRAMDGTSIEVLNTDAEGRLALADAIAYAALRLKPARIIDLATLTGACSIALGGEAMALMGNDDALIEALARAGDHVHERAWHMPLFEEYADYIKSDIADIKNIGRARSGGLVTAGYFLKRFAGNTPWAHMDIAGTAWADIAGEYRPKGATGIGVRLLMRYLSTL